MFFWINYYKLSIMEEADHNKSISLLKPDWGILWLIYMFVIFVCLDWVACFTFLTHFYKKNSWCQPVFTEMIFFVLTSNAQANFSFKHRKDMYTCMSIIFIIIHKKLVIQSLGILLLPSEKPEILLIQH